MGLAGWGINSNQCVGRVRICPNHVSVYLMEQHAIYKDGEVQAPNFLTSTSSLQHCKGTDLS